MKGNGGCLHPCALGLALGLLWGVSVLFMAVISMYTADWGHSFVKLLGELYVGYNMTWSGSVVGFIWALIDGFIGGFLLAWLYNFFNRMC